MRPPEPRPDLTVGELRAWLAGYAPEMRVRMTYDINDHDTDFTIIGFEMRGDELIVLVAA